MKKPQLGILSLSADDAANQALEVAIEWAKGYGRMTAIAEQVSAATGAPVSRQMVGRWLNSDPAKRVQTSLGMGLMLWHVCDEMKRDTAGKFTGPRSFVDIDIALFANTAKKRSNPKKK